MGEREKGRGGQGGREHRATVGIPARVTFWSEGGFSGAGEVGVYELAG